MKNEELAGSLREIFTIVNEEARLVGEATLDKCLSRIFEGPGPDWLLETAQSCNLVDTSQVSQKAPDYQALLRSESGRKELKMQIAARREEIEKWRRKLVAHMRLWQTDKPSLEFHTEDTADAREIYGILAPRSN